MAIKPAYLQKQPITIQLFRPALTQRKARSAPLPRSSSLQKTLIWQVFPLQVPHTTGSVGVIKPMSSTQQKFQSDPWQIWKCKLPAHLVKILTDSEKIASSIQLSSTSKTVSESMTGMRRLPIRACCRTTYETCTVTMICTRWWRHARLHSCTSKWKSSPTKKSICGTCQHGHGTLNAREMVTLLSQP